MPTLTLPRSVLASAVAGLFRAASHVRGERTIHARGRAFTGRLTVTGGAGTGAQLLDAPDGRRLRFSPAHAGGGLELAGPMQEWRRRSYAATHVGADA